MNGQVSILDVKKNTYNNMNKKPNENKHLYTKKRLAKREKMQS